LEASKTSKTLINKRRTLGKPFDFAQTYSRRTSVIEVNHWAKVAINNINVQNRSLYASLQRHCTSKTANIKKVILLSSNWS